MTTDFKRDLFDQPFRKRARRYQMRRLILNLAGSVLEFVVLISAFWWMTGDGWWWAAARPLWGGAAFFAVMAALRRLITLPLDFYSSYRLPHGEGLSRESLAGWAWDRLKGWLIQVFLGGCASGGLLELMTAWPNRWWWISAAGAAVLIVTVILLAPVLLAPLFYRFKPLGDVVLGERLEALLIRTGARIRGGVWEMDESRKSNTANAALVGWGPSRRVVLSDTLLDFTPEEIEAVLAHEIAHHMGRHISKLVAFRVVFITGGLYLAHLAFSAPPFFSTLGMAPIALGHPLAIAALWVLFGIANALFSPFFLAYSRRLEHGCDRFSVSHTKETGGLSSALMKLGRRNLTDPSPPGWVVALFHSHPPLWARLSSIQEAEAGVQP